MKLSVFYDHILQAAAQTGKPLPELLKKAKNAGIDAVEVNLTYLCEHEETYGLLQTANLGISCIYEFYAMDQKDEWEKAKLHIDTAVKSCAEKILVVPGFLTFRDAETMKGYVADYSKTADFLNRNEKALSMAKGLACIVEMGYKANVTVTVEDFDDVRSPLSGLNGVRWFLEQVPGLKCTYDTGNFITHGEDPLAAWDMLKEKAAHVHCKDRGSMSVAVGDGYLPMNAMIRKIASSGYDGYLAIEHFDAEDQESAMVSSAAFLVQAWHSSPVNNK